MLDRKPCPTCKSMIPSQFLWNDGIQNVYVSPLLGFGVPCPDPYHKYPAPAKPGTSYVGTHILAEAEKDYLFRCTGFRDGEMRMEIAKDDHFPCEHAAGFVTELRKLADALEELVERAEAEEERPN